MKKIIILLAALLFLVSCQGQGGFSDQFSGTNGVIFEFSTNSPPRTIFEGSPVFVSLDLWNQGAYDITEDSVIQLSYDPLHFQKDDGSSSGIIFQEFQIRGRGNVFPNGERRFVGITNLNSNSIEGQFSDRRTTMTATLCYPYKTYFSDTFCIDADFFAQEQNPVCRSGRPSTYSGQGAPVAVTRVESQMIPIGTIKQEDIANNPLLGPDGELIDLGLVNEPVRAEDGTIIDVQEVPSDIELIQIQPSFEITIKNVGRGDVFYSDSQTVTNACRSAAQRQFNRLKISAFLASQELECITNTADENIIRLEERGEVTISCRLPFEDIIPMIFSYEDVLNIELEYFYTNSKSLDLTIKRAS